jgi:glycosyltransferase involved in cell wall biosynthesis
MKSNEKPLISIIVPVYNVEPYVKKCIDSILAQSYEKIEVLLVDDGSTDASGVICDDCAKKDGRIKVIHKKNGGVSSARNAGLEVIKGDYISFVDGDDALKADFIEKLYEDIARTGSDVSICGFRRFDESGETTYSEANFAGVISSDDAIALLLENKFYPAPWGKLFKKKIFKKIRYNEHYTYGEDLDVTARYLRDNLVISFDGENKSYLYRTRADSAMGKGVYRKNCRELFDVCDEIIKREKGGKNEKIAYSFYVEKVLGFCMDCIKYNHKDKEELEFLRERLVKYDKQQKVYYGRTKQEKIICFLFLRKQYGLIRCLSAMKAR